MLLTLLACGSGNVSQGKPGLEEDTDTGSTVTDSETATTGETDDSATTTDTWDQDTGSYPYHCGELGTPYADGTREELFEILENLAFDREGFEFALFNAVQIRVENYGDCDQAITDGSGRTILSGDCVAADGSVYGGFATVQITETENIYHFEDFSFDYVTAEGTLSFDANGDVTLALDGSGDLDIHYSLGSASDVFVGVFGEFERNATMTNTEQGQTGKGWMKVLSSDEVDVGEVCFDVDYVFDSTVCTLEPIGSGSFVGTNLTDAVFDGDTSCDGCINLTVDGVDQGSVCP